MSVASRLGSLVHIAYGLARSLATAILALSIAAGTVASQPANTVAAGSGPITFDIRSQELAQALDAYAAATGVQILYESSLVSGLRSAEVKGDLAPHTALRMLLAGTGLSGRRTDIDAVTLFPDDHDARTGMVQPDTHFLGSLQASITDALCRHPETKPGGYRAALQLWITSDGAIQRASLLSSTGDTRRDATFAEAVKGATVSARPPPNMAQPITLVIVPTTTQCRD